MVELLAPVRDITSFNAAIHSGADSVYFGLGSLNMRASSKGIEVSDLKRIVEIAHDKNKKVYITLNVLIYENELKRLDIILDKCKEANVDAIICWDFAVIQKCKEQNIPFHISTQASISNSASARFFEALGASCIVLARECNLEQIKNIKRKIKTKIEVFIHGAMCVSISGRCLISQYLYCESANRGECLQPCRREYKVIEKETGYELELGNNFVMSPKDLCALPVIDKLIEAGIDVFKIEGRSRSAEYVSTVVKAYRTAIDSFYEQKFNPELANKLIEDVSKVYNRKFSLGFLFNVPGVEDWTDSDGTSATTRKEYIGKVVNYYNKVKMTYIWIEAGSIAVGDILQIQGPTTGIFEVNVDEIRVENNSVETAGKGEATFRVDLKVRPNDKVYKIIKN
jgi:U32 family peptidase